MSRKKLGPSIAARTNHAGPKAAKTMPRQSGGLPNIARSTTSQTPPMLTFEPYPQGDDGGQSLEADASGPN